MRKGVITVMVILYIAMTGSHIYSYIKCKEPYICDKECYKITEDSLESRYCGAKVKSCYCPLEDEPWGGQKPLYYQRNPCKDEKPNISDKYCVLYFGHMIVHLVMFILMFFFAIFVFCAFWTRPRNY